jgi:Tfp pilus assembly protein FimT
MNFIERMFGVSPDGGNGATETMIVVAVLAILVAVALSRVLRRQTRDRH